MLLQILLSRIRQMQDYIQSPRRSRYMGRPEADGTLRERFLRMYDGSNSYRKEPFEILDAASHQEVFEGKRRITRLDEGKIIASLIT